MHVSHDDGDEGARVCGYISVIYYTYNRKPKNFTGSHRLPNIFQKDLYSYSQVTLKIMKHTLLVFALSVTLGSYLNAQIVAPIGELVISGNIANPEDVELKTHIDIQNVSSSTLDLKLYRQIIEPVFGSQNKFCWGGLCYELNTNESIFSQVLDPGQVAPGGDPLTGFTGYYYHNEVEGCATVRYCLYEVGNAANETCFDVVYAVDCAVNVNEQARPAADLGEAFPNPAADRASFTYNFGYQPVNGKLVIYNMVGKVIKEIPARNALGFVHLDLSDFPQGLYLYTLQDGTEVLGTHKLVVSK